MSTSAKQGYFHNPVIQVFQDLKDLQRQDIRG